MAVPELEVLIKRSQRRKTLVFKVQDAQVIVLAPADLSQSRIVELLQERRAWLLEHVQRQRAQQLQVQPWQDGETLPYLGESLLVRLKAQPHVERHGPELWVPQEDAGAAIRRWTRRAVQQPYQSLVSDCAGALGAEQQLRAVKVCDTRSRWGSCSAQGVVRLHWALSRAPLEVLRYVALHETAHLLELNHSARYWAHLNRLMPGHQQHRAWLRVHGAALLLR